MKKLIALILALCLMAMMVPAMAEGESKLGALLGMAGSVLNGSDGDDAASLDDLMDAAGVEGDAEALGSLMDMLGALGGADGESSEPAYTAVPADSLDQFYGTWTISKVAFGGMEIPMEMLDMLGMEASAEITLTENSISGAASFSSGDDDEATSKEGEVAAEMSLVDGALNVTVQGEALVFQLTDAGELVIEVPEVGAMFFKPAA